MQYDTRFVSVADKRARHDFFLEWKKRLETAQAVLLLNVGLIHYSGFGESDKRPPRIENLGQGHSFSFFSHVWRVRR